MHRASKAVDTNCGSRFPRPNVTQPFIFASVFRTAEARETLGRSLDAFWPRRAMLKISFGYNRALLESDEFNHLYVTYEQDI